MRIKLALGVAALTAFSPMTALATNGYFSHGYGTISKGMAGAGTALSQDSIAAATNPAGMAFVGNRIDGGFEVFSPRREYTVEGPVSCVLIAAGHIQKQPQRFRYPPPGL